ncbi:acetaldehyde dehydrogenase / alcohol dehydrogenase [Desulfotomaculum arcticum]|uniref:Aldehyde-alcohol dehydrogenase n=1 Tax=Desulfotruncus arcticus DSM 17038 TaxID=1121424 RepID=A0A1I2U192_9FIRM|nr:bifunctional acetaldehyde-CoA/alcohol dehydrogenase [Desulfotruncus arcticus]SFG70918.1 acetaldehyde dehydrogenase / alcohol dehydrogenase [Desulfotomaculum arcticum] [Desulfotruncus arcticus DSM 17038]
MGGKEPKFIGDEKQLMVDKLVEKAEKARQALTKLNQEQIDHIVRAMALAGLDKHMELARLAVEETKRGVYEDKMIKNIFATESVYHSIKYKKTVGVISVNDEEDFMEVAEPVGVIAAVIPVTNPTSTTMFKSLICLKTANPVIFSFHPGARRCSAAAAKTMLDAAVEAGAPADCITWIEHSSIEATGFLMNHPGVQLILATGGAGLVRAAYSTGKPALGVGPGNVPCYIEKSAKVKRAVTDLILSKTFDNGLICASEQSIVIDRDIYQEVTSLMQHYGCYFLGEDEAAKLEQLAVKGEDCSLNPAIVGQSAYDIAKMAGFEVPPNTKILVAPQQGVGPQYPLSMEKLSPVLACYQSEEYRDGIKRCEEIIGFGGLGHSAVLHSENKEVVDLFSRRMRVGRIIINSPASHGAIGDLYNVNVPSLTLGCGSMGHNATTSNVSVDNLINVKRVSSRREKLQWFRVPERVYFAPGSVQYLEKMQGLERVIIVTDPGIVKLGFLDKVIYHLRKRNNPVMMEVFSEVEPDPSVDTVQKGCTVMRQFQPDTIIALGGGSPIDAAKAMWLFYEHPEVEFEFLKLKFLDIRKRTYKYPKLGRKARLVAIPTTSGTGSEVSAFAVITHRGRDIKYPLADYELTPDVAIIDPEFVNTMPPAVTADTGLDVLTHAVEAYVSVLASDYTDAMALKATELVFKYLPASYQSADNREARGKMHNASCIAGMAFTNAFLGVCHSLAHKIGGEFHIPHGRANAILLPHVIRYNSEIPSKFASFPQYEYYQAPEKFRQMAALLGLPAANVQEGVNSLIDAVEKLRSAVGVPATIAECGVDAELFKQKVPELAEKAFDDQSTTANPRMPLIEELAAILLRAYDNAKHEHDLIRNVNASRQHCNPDTHVANVVH